MPCTCAGMVADGSEMHKQQLQAWAEGASGVPMVSEYTVPWVAVENPHARDLAVEWMASANESVAASGWCTYSGLVATRADALLDLAEIERLLAAIVKRNPYGAEPGSIYDEWVCHRGGNVCETLAETSEGGRSEDRRSFRWTSATPPAKCRWRVRTSPRTRLPAAWGRSGRLSGASVVSHVIPDNRVL